ncbi:MAG TPA: ABC transporter ATP-binding protein [Aquihabitans sp.]|nr:ABC transporter ATP-binding protein [Aquihabitans sp.]
MPDLHISGLRKAFAGNVALDDVDIDGKDGELLTLLGPSGCGKSTTLWSIAGLHDPDRGRISVGDAVLFDHELGIDLPPEARECGVVFQSYAVWPNMTVADNVGYPLKLRRVKGADRAARVAEVLELVELGDLAGRYPHQLSGGQQQRVALGRALAFPPRLLLLDEPFSNLDAKLRERARTWLRDLQREIGITTVFVTHDQDEALSMSDRIVVMDHGVVRQVGTPEEIYEAPADLFVADFIGTINLLEGHVLRQTEAHVEVAVPGLPTPLLATPVRHAGSSHDGSSHDGAVTLAVRPEVIVLDPDPGHDGLNRATATVIDRSYLGDHVRYRMQLGDAVLTVQTSTPVYGGEVTVGLPTERTLAYEGAGDRG